MSIHQNGSTNKPTPASGLVAATYERVSTVMQARAGFSFVTQHQSTEEYCRANNLILPSHLRFRDGEEKNASGKDWDLPDLTRMLAAARAGEFTILVVPDVDRFARNMAKSLVLEHELSKYGVEVCYMNLPVTDPSPEGGFMKRTLQNIAEYEREKIRFRTATNRRTKAQLGLYVGTGTAPFGYRCVRGGPRNRIIGLQVIEQEAEIVRTLFGLALHKSLVWLLRWLDEHSTPSPSVSRGTAITADAWHARTVGKILKNPLYIGKAKYSGIEIPVPPIVDQATFDAVQQALRSRCKRAGGWRRNWGTDGDAYLFRGLLICAECSQKAGEPVYLRAHVHNIGNPYEARYYVCPNRYDSRADRAEPLDERCRLPSLRADVVEARFWQQLVAALLDPEKVRADLESARARQAEFEAEYRERIDATETVIRKEQKRLDRIVQRISEFDPENITDDDREELAAQERQREELKKTLAGLRRQIRDLEAGLNSVPFGMSQAGVDAVMAAIEELRQGAEAVTTAEKRRMIEIFRFRGYVSSTGEDAFVVRRRPKSLAAIDWRGEIHVKSGNSFRKSMPKM